MGRSFEKSTETLHIVFIGNSIMKTKFLALIAMEILLRHEKD